MQLHNSNIQQVMPLVWGGTSGTPSSSTCAAFESSEGRRQLDNNYIKIQMAAPQDNLPSAYPVFTQMTCRCSDFLISNGLKNSEYSCCKGRRDILLHITWFHLRYLIVFIVCLTLSLSKVMHLLLKTYKSLSEAQSGFTQTPPLHLVTHATQTSF